MPQCKVHNVGFYRPDPKGIYSMSLERTENRLAVARSDASIEIWNITHIPFIEKTIPSNLENFSIEGLCWSNNRLFSTGLHGWLVEYDLYSLSVKDKWTVTGEAGTCLDANSSLIAVGTEHGYVNIFRVIDNAVEYEKLLDKQEGHILCLKFSVSGEFVVGGGINAIRIWNVKSGHAIHKMVLGRSEAKKDTVVWCLEVMSDFTIFSGDSRGVLTLWDGKMGAQIESYQSHKADITAICLNKNEQSLYSAGIDPLISNYEKVKVGANVKWVKSIQRKIHDHDVRAMVLHKGKLYSAGVDSYLVCSYHPPKTLIKYAPILQSPCVQVAIQGRMILLRYSKHIEIWSLGEAQKTPDNYRGAIELKIKPKKLVMIQKIGKNWAKEDEAEGIICSSISSDGQWIFLGTSTGYRLYRLEMRKAKPKLTKIDDLDDNGVPSIQGAFNDKHKQLIVALSNGSIVVYELEDDNPFVSQRIERNKGHLSDTVSLLTVSSCGKYLVAADSQSNIVVFHHTKDGYSFEYKLPRYRVAPTAMGVNSATSCVVVAFADNKVREFNLKLKMVTELSTKLEQSNEWKNRTHIIRSIIFDSRNKDAILLHDDSSIIVINKQATSSGSKLPKKTPKKETASSEEPLKIRSIQKHKHLVHLAALEDGELVAVEVNPLSILEKLPPAFAQKTFGTK